MKGSNWLYSTWKLYLNTKRYKPETIRQQAMSSAFWQIVAILCWPKVKVGRSEKVEMVQKSNFWKMRTFETISDRLGNSKLDHWPSDQGLNHLISDRNFRSEIIIRTTTRRQNGPRTRPVYRKTDRTK